MVMVALFLAASRFSNFQKPQGQELAGIELITICSTESDLQFLIHVAEINMEEVLLGQLAQQKSKSPDIQKLGKMMEETHSQSFIDLKEIAKKQNLKIPTIPTHKARWTYKKLNKISRDDFDLTYCNLMVEEHRYIITVFEKELKKSDDEEITKWTRSMLPTLHAHLTYALNCQNKCENVFTGN